MVHPGAFQGARKDFLLGEKAAYFAGVDGGYAKDALSVIQRRYLKRFPLDWPHDREPTAEELAAVNDEEPEPERDPPNEASLTPEDYAAAMGAYKERQELLQFRKAQIKRWLSYQYMKDHDLDSRNSGAQSSLRLLLNKLTHGKAGRPRLKTASNIWQRDHRDEIEAETKRRAEKAQTPKNKVASLRESVASELFAKANAAEKDRCKAIADAEHKAALAEWQASMDGKFSVNPADRQRSIDGLASFMRPILEGVCEATGWKASLTMGGPEPAMGGRLNTVSVHTGHAPGDIKMTYGRAERASFKKYTLPSFGHFLRTCYSIEDCRAAALPLEEQVERALPTEDDPTVTLFQIDPNDSPLENDILTAESPKKDNRGDSPPVPPSPTKDGDHEMSSSTPPQAEQNKAEETTVPQHDLSPTTRTRVELDRPSAAYSGEAAQGTHDGLPGAEEDPCPEGEPRLPEGNQVNATQIQPPLETNAPCVPDPEDRTRLSSPPPCLQDVSPPSSPRMSRTSPTQCDVVDTSQSPQFISDPDSMDVDGPTHPPQPAPEPAPDEGGDVACSAPSAPMTDVDQTNSYSSPATTSSISTPPVDSEVRSVRPLPPSLPPIPSKSTTDVHTERRLRIAPAGSSHPTPTSFTSTRTSEMRKPKMQRRAPPATAQRSCPVSISTSSTASSDTSSSDEPSMSFAGRRRSKRRQDDSEISCRDTSDISKRRRVSLAPIIPSDSAPLYLSKGIELFNDKNLGDDWLGLVKLWTAFEAVEGYQQKKALSRTGRPAAVQEWINRKRSAQWRPKIANPSHYALQCSYWWTNIQPDWRVSHDGYLLSDKLDGDWSDLRLPGQNSIMNFLVALYFYGVLTLEHPELRADWIDIVTDCKQALAMLCSTQ